MLSPASLRVCCLAVMAPALTKADRRANCLPVELSDPFCVSKTDASENRKDNINQIAKLPFPQKRKSPHKIWVRTNGAAIPNGNKISAIDFETDFKLGLHVEPKSRPCHGTNVRTMAAKVRLKYTMNKNNSSFKSMGLAKATTSLGLHSMKRMERISQLSSNNKGNSDVEKGSGENLPDLADPTSSELEDTFLVRIVQPALEQSIEEVSSSSRNLIASSKHETFVSLSDSDTLPVLSDASVAGLVPDNCSIPLSPDTNTALSARDSVLPLSLPCTDSILDVTGSKGMNNSHSNISPFHEIISCDDNSNSPVDQAQKNDCSTPKSPIVSDHEYSPSHNSFPLPSENCLEIDISPLSPGYQSDVEAPSPCSSVSSSSTLSAAESPLPSSEDEGDTSFFQCPELLFQDSKGPLLEVQGEGCYHVPCSMVKSYFEDCPAPCGSEFRTCCPVSEQDAQSAVSELSVREKVLGVRAKEAEAILHGVSIRDTHKQLGTLVGKLQRRYDVPCQRPSRTKTAIDFKAEMLQREDAKNLSTAAMLSLVRDLENKVPKLCVEEPLPEPVVASSLVDSSEEVTHTGRKLLGRMRSLLRSKDFYMTDSSEEETPSDIEVEEALEDPFHKKHLWTYLRNRSTLGSRATWLSTRISDLENQLTSITNTCKNITSSIGDIRFEDHAATTVPSETTSTLSTAGSDGPSSSKPNKPKGLGRAKPLNGILDFGKSSSSRPERKPSGPSVADQPQNSSRIRPLATSSFQKRKLLEMTGLHLSNPKLARLSTTACHCNSLDEVMPCVLCMGRYACVQSVDPDSLALLDRVALLDPTFHPVLSSDKDIPLLMHYANIMKKNDAEYQVIRPPSPPVLENHQRTHYDSTSNHLSEARSRSRKYSRYARSLLSEKYRNKKHFRKHKLVFGKWRKFHKKTAFHTRNRFRRLSVASSASSHDSPIPSPGSAFEEGLDFKRRTGEQFDIDDVIIPYSNKKDRLVKFEFKDIEIPSWRSKAFGDLENIDMEEDTSDAAFIKRHETYEVEERKIIRSGGGAKCFFNNWQKRSSRISRSDSRADSSGANTPDPVLIYDQDFLYQGRDNIMRTQESKQHKRSNGVTSKPIRPPMEIYSPRKLLSKNGCTKVHFVDHPLPKKSSPPPSTVGELKSALKRSKSFTVDEGKGVEALGFDREAFPLEYQGLVRRAVLESDGPHASAAPDVAPDAVFRSTATTVAPAHDAQQQQQCALQPQHGSFSNLQSLPEVDNTLPQIDKILCICPYCPFSTSSRLKMNNHRKTHLLNYQYGCSYCHKLFRARIQLKNHNAMHTGEKPFQCHVCQKYFSLKGNLRTHLFRHNKKGFYSDV